jgi:asparagine synthase (glutamine-hydrolysing)
MARFVGPRDSRTWKSQHVGDATIWFAGYLYDHADPQAALAAWPVGGEEREISAFLDRLDGHFALVCECPGEVIAAVDPIRSFPIFFLDSNSETIVAAGTDELRSYIDSANVDPASALALAMSGYTIGNKTLYKKLHQLAPGEFLMAGGKGGARRVRYHRYSPWAIVEDSEEAFERRFADLNMLVHERIARQAQNRLIAIPLSAGRDSRVIVSTLAEVGARNVMCFAYGLPGNYEVEASRKIAKRLGYDWHFVPMTLGSQRSFWRSDLNAKYQDFADSNCSTTVIHDLPVINDLLQRKIIDTSAIVINGNSGDYITGLHIQPPISGGLDGLGYEQRMTTVVTTLIKKHFRLWDALATPDNDRVIKAQLLQEIAALNLGEISAAQTHGLHEYCEFQDRQSKYVVSRQRIYEFLGLEWRLPLWSRDYLDFWQTVPLSLKRGQALYARTLTKRNWGGVWQGDEWTFARRVSPGWMRYGVRPAAMALCAPFGQQSWHRFERQFLRYWMDLIGLEGIVPYWRAATDRRGARHAIARLTEAYLARKGLSWNGQLL